MMKTIERITERWGASALVALLVATGVVAVIEPFGWNIPRNGRIIGLAAAATAVVAYYPAQRLAEYIYTPSHTFLLEVNAATDKFRLWAVEPTHFQETTVEDGTDLYQWSAKVSLYECREYDPEANHAVGTWRGSATDLELLEGQEKIREIRGDLEQMAREGLALRVRITSITRSATTDAVKGVLQALESSAAVMPDEGAIQGAVDRALPEDTRKAIEDGRTDGKDEHQEEPDDEHEPEQTPPDRELGDEHEPAQVTIDD